MRPSWDYLNAPDTALIVLIISIFLLVLLAVLFAIGVLLLRWRNELVAARWRRLESKWRGHILSLLAGEGDVTALQQRVARDDQIHFLIFLDSFARRLRGKERAVLLRMAQPALPRLNKELRARSAERRARALYLLSMLGGKATDKPLLEALDDPSPLVAMVAARALARRRDARYLRHILARASRFYEWDPRYLAAMLAEVGPEATDELREALVGGKGGTYARSVAAEALARLHDLPSAEIAARLLGSSDDPQLIRACLRLLGAVGQRHHAEIVRRVVTLPDDSVRATAIAALGHLGNEQDIPLLTAAFTDRSPWVVIRAAAALKRIAAPEVVERIADENPAAAPALREIMDTSDT